MKVYRGQVIYVDVDDTIISHHDIPKPHVIQFLRHAVEKGAILYLWSAGGDTYAEGVALKLGIHHLFKAFLAKPDATIDDLDIKADFIMENYHPNHFLGRNFEDEES